MRVFVLLYNARTDNEGLHTERIGDRNKVLMFESEDDATRFALMLEAQDFPVPDVEPIDDEEIKRFCLDGDFDWEIISTGELRIPAKINLEKPDWDKDTPTENQPQVEENEVSDSELESIRRKLEGLL